LGGFVKIPKVPKASNLPKHMNEVLSEASKVKIRAMGRRAFPPTSLPTDFAHFPTTTNAQVMAKARALGWDRETLTAFVNENVEKLYWGNQSRMTNRSTRGPHAKAMDLDVGDLNPDIATAMEKFHKK
jgi:hypothetical protein